MAAAIWMLALVPRIIAAPVTARRVMRWPSRGGARRRQRPRAPPMCRPQRPAVARPSGWPQWPRVRTEEFVRALEDDVRMRPDEGDRRPEGRRRGCRPRGRRTRWPPARCRPQPGRLWQRRPPMSARSRASPLGPRVSEVPTGSPRRRRPGACPGRRETRPAPPRQPPAAPGQDRRGLRSRSRCRRWPWPRAWPPRAPIAVRHPPGRGAYGRIGAARRPQGRAGWRDRRRARARSPPGRWAMAWEHGRSWGCDRARARRGSRSRCRSSAPPRASRGPGHYAAA